MENSGVEINMINELYNLFGEIFETAQYIEWNLALLICKSQNTNADNMFNDMQDMTMGQIIGYAKDARLFNEDAICELEYILDKRNYLAHQFFKQNDIVKHSDNEKFLGNKVGELNNILIRFQNYNKRLSVFYRNNFE